MAQYSMTFPRGMAEKVKRVSVLKAVQECTKIPAEVKAKAAEKCATMSFNPTMF